MNAKLVSKIAVNANFKAQKIRQSRMQSLVYQHNTSCLKIKF